MFELVGDSNPKTGSITVDEPWMRENWTSIMTQVYNLIMVGNPHQPPENWVGAAEMEPDKITHRWKSTLQHMMGWKLHPDAAVRMFAFGMVLFFMADGPLGTPGLCLMEAAPGSSTLLLGWSPECTPFVMHTPDGVDTANLPMQQRLIQGAFQPPRDRG